MLGWNINWFEAQMYSILYSNQIIILSITNFDHQKIVMLKMKN